MCLRFCKLAELSFDDIVFGCYGKSITVCKFTACKLNGIIKIIVAKLNTAVAYAVYGNPRAGRKIGGNNAFLQRKIYGAASVYCYTILVENDRNGTSAFLTAETVMVFPSDETDSSVKSPSKTRPARKLLLQL